MSLNNYRIKDGHLTNKNKIVQITIKAEDKINDCNSKPDSDKVKTMQLKIVLKKSLIHGWFLEI